MLFRSQKSLAFSLQANGFRSKEYILNVVAKPTISSFELNCDYPAYTNKPDETLKGIGPISAYKNILEYHTIQALFEAKPHLKEDHFDYILVRTFFTNPCKEAIYNKENQDIKKISITFNPLPAEYNITKIKDRYPITKFSKWLSSYSNWFVLE